MPCPWFVSFVSVLLFFFFFFSFLSSFTIKTRLDFHIVGEESLFLLSSSSFQTGMKQRIRRRGEEEDEPACSFLLLFLCIYTHLQKS